MKAYVYQAALICEDCANMCTFDTDSIWSEADSKNSEYYPQGPYENGGGEADCPQHCDICQVFLKNPLTRDGEQYVKDHVCELKAGNAVVAEWMEYYSYLFD